jgi:hypothetical protein
MIILIQVSFYWLQGVCGLVSNQSIDWIDFKLYKEYFYIYRYIYMYKDTPTDSWN